jgi:alpha-tubulin suppressor-like RCC1 family protein
MSHTALLKIDGTVVVCGNNKKGECGIPALNAGLTYTQVAAGMSHTVLLKSDRTVVACGDNAEECDIPALSAGLTYTCCCRFYFTVVLKSDGTVVACGRNDYGQCDECRCDLYTSGCRNVSHRSAEERWCSCRLWTRLLRTVRHSSIECRCDLYTSCCRNV